MSADPRRAHQDLVRALERLRSAERSAVIQVAIDARHQHFPDETPFAYQPFAGREDEFRHNARTAETVIKDYFMKDLAI